MNKNTKRRVDAARDAFGRCKMGRASGNDAALAENVGHKPRRYRNAKVGASGPDISRRLGPRWEER